FFFADYEGQRESGVQSSLACVPSPADVAAAVAAIGGSSNVNAVTGALLGTTPWPRTTVSDSNRASQGVDRTTADPLRNRVDSVIGKIDQSFNPANLLTGRYYFGDSDQSFPLSLVNGGALPGFNTLTPTRINLVSLSYLNVLSPTRINEVRFGFNRFHETFF